MHTDPAQYVRSAIRSVPDWPKPGVTFRDITPVLQDPRSFRVLMDLFVYRYMQQKLDLVAGVDARGFILGAVLAYELNLGFVPVRNGSLPFLRTGTKPRFSSYASTEPRMKPRASTPATRSSFCCI